MKQGDKEKKKRNIWKIIAFIFLGVILLFVTLVGISIIDHYRFINDNRVMEMIEAEMKELPDKEVMDSGLINVGSYIGMFQESVVDQLGEPEENGSWNGADYYSYSKSLDMLLYWSYDSETRVSGVSYFGNDKILGVSCGMTISEAEGILGKPVDKGLDEGYTPPEAYISYLIKAVKFSNMDEVVDIKIVYYASGEDGPISYIDILAIN
ncbi:MAG: hypothetical protein PHQ32_00230 [Firmicutes bacterium]|nr:hypothetical protein [Bacillota bacterium]